MRRVLRSLIVLLVLGGAPAFAASLEATRVEAQSARKRVNDIRSRQMALRLELNQVASRIEALKGQQKGALIPGGELESSLRRSQELSGLLTTAAQELSQAVVESERGQVALLDSLSAELASVRAQWDRTGDRKGRGELLGRMRSLRTERDQVRSLIPASKVPQVATRSSEDPEDLLEQADVLRDSEDKVRQKMVALRARIAEVREERELDRRMSDFLSDENLFDDQDRRLRRVQVRSVGGSSDLAPQNDPSVPVKSGDGFATSSPEAAPSKSVSITQVARASDSRPQMGDVPGLPLDGADSANLSELERQLGKLEDLAKTLGGRADRIEQKARDLQ